MNKILCVVFLDKFCVFDKVRKAQKHLLIPFTLCAFLLVSAVVWQIVHSQRLASLESRRQVLGREIQNLRLVVTDILDAETGQRGFLLTGGKVAYLEPYNKARESLKKNFSELKNSLKDNPARTEKLQSIEKNTSLKMAELEETIAAFGRGNRAGALQTVLSGRGKSHMDVLRVELDEIIVDMTKERASIGTEALTSINSVRNGLIAMSLAICAILVFTYFLVSRAEKERARFAAELEYAAHHDQLTGLPNRHYLKAHFAEVLHAASTKRLRLALLYIDLDNFKTVNDTHGHDAGDRVLKDAVTILSGLLDDAATLIRLGGDEFALIYAPAPSDAALSQLAAKMISELSAVRLADGTPTGISASIGVALFPENSESETDLFQAADKAMYRAKNAGKSRVMFSDEKSSLAS